MRNSFQSPVSSSQSAATEDWKLETGNSPIVPLFSFATGHQICRVLDPLWIEAEFSKPGFNQIELLENVRDWLLLSMLPNVQSRAVFVIQGPEGGTERFLTVSFDSHRIRILPALPGGGSPDLVCSICRWFSVETFEDPLFRWGDAKIASHPLLILPEEGVREVEEGASLERSGGAGISVDDDDPVGYFFLKRLLSKYGKDIDSFLRTSGVGVNNLPGYSQTGGFLGFPKRISKKQTMKMFSWVVELMGVTTPEALTLDLAELREKLDPKILIPDDREVRTTLDMDMPWISTADEFKKWLDESQSSKKDRSSA